MREVLFTADAVRQYKRLPKAVRSLIREAIRIQLIEGNPTQTTRNKFRLRRPSDFADYELREGDYRVFYRVEHEEVVITLLGEKRTNKLIVEGEELNL